MNLYACTRKSSEKTGLWRFCDVKEYIQIKERMLEDYEDEKVWEKKMLVNIAKAGFFSSDRTIAEYNKDIWKL